MSNIWGKRIPTLFGLLLIIIGIGITSFLTKNGTIITTRATPTVIPQNMRITNLTDSSFSVSYITETETPGSVSFGKNKNTENIIIDEKDTPDKTISPHKIHYFTINNLEPNTKYYFVVISGNNTYSNNNIPFEVSTVTSLEQKISSEKTIDGKVIMPDGELPKEGIAYLSGNNIQPLSVSIKNDGTYMFNISSIRNQKLNSLASLSENDILQINTRVDSLESDIKILAKQASRVPITILSKNYDFTIDSSISFQENSSSESAKLVGFPTFSPKNTINDTLRILTPKKDEMFTDQQPLFKGAAKPGSIIKITIHSSNNIEDQVKTDTKGNWSYRPKTPLAPGSHILTISITDAFGMLKTITQSFTVFALGSQVMESATPSAAPTPTAAPSVSLTPTTAPTAKPTLAPTFTPIPTFNPTNTPTQAPIIPSPVPTKIAKPSKPPGNSSVIIGGIVAIATTLAGIVLFLLSRGNISL